MKRSNGKKPREGRVEVNMDEEKDRLVGKKRSELDEADKAVWDDIFVKGLFDFRREHELDWGEDFRTLIMKVLENDGLCPCKPKNAEDNACPCNEAIERTNVSGSCRCGLFVKHDDPLEPCAEALGKLYEVLGELNSVSDPVSTAVMKLRIQEKIYSGVSSIIEDVKPGAYKALDRYTPEEMLMAASILERASDEGLGAVMAYTNHKFGEKGNKVLRDLIEMDIIRYRMESVIGLGDTLRLRVMANDPSLAKHIVGGKISIIDFSAEWCGPCKKMGAVLDSVKKESDDVAVFKIDVDEETELAEKYGISGVPFAVIFGKDRKPLEAMSGFPGEEALRRSIEAARA